MSIAPQTECVGKITDLNHRFLVRNPPSGLLWVVVDRYDRMEVRRIGVCLPESALLCLDLRL